MTTKASQRSLLKQYETYIQKAAQALSSGQNRHAREYLSLACQRLFELAELSSGPLRQERLHAAETLLRRVEQIDAPDHRESCREAATGPTTRATGGKERPADQTQSDTVTRFAPAQKAGISLRDVAGLEAVKQAIHDRIIDPFLHPDQTREFGIRPGGGILMYGPPGTGKSLLAEAVAAEVDADYFPVHPDDVLSKWVGDPEKNIAALFERARASTCAVIFFDEVDALAARRDDADGYMRRIVNQLLAEMQSPTADESAVLVIGATNHPELLDSAIIRPGRFDELIEVPLPDYATREQLWHIHLRKRQRLGNIDFGQLAERSQGYSGAEIAWLCDGAARKALRRWKAGEQNARIEMRDIQEQIAANGPRTTAEQVLALRAWSRQARRQTGTAIDQTSTDETPRRRGVEYTTAPHPPENPKQAARELLEERRNFMTPEQAHQYLTRLDAPDCDASALLEEIDRNTRRPAAQALVEQALDDRTEMPDSLRRKLRAKAVRRLVFTLECPTLASARDLLATLREEIGRRRAATEEEGGKPNQAENFEDVVIRNPVVDYSDVAGMDELKDRLDLVLAAALDPRYRTEYRALTGHDPEAPQVLLYGAPGCGKSLLLNAIAGEYALRYGMSVIDVPHRAIVGKDWRQWLPSIMEIYDLARRQSPCILLWDEFDVLVRNSAASVGRHMVKVGYELRRQLARAVQDKDHFIVNLAATNYPWRIDPAILRPGRLGTVIHIPAPDRPARLGLIDQLLSDARLDPEVDLDALADAGVNMTAAEIVACCEQGLALAAARSLAHQTPGDGSVCQEDLQKAFTQRRASDFAAWLTEASVELNKPSFAGARRLFAEFLQRDIPDYLKRGAN